MGNLYIFHFKYCEDKTENGIFSDISVKTTAYITAWPPNRFQVYEFI